MQLNIHTEYPNLSLSYNETVNFRRIVRIAKMLQGLFFIILKGIYFKIVIL